MSKMISTRVASKILKANGFDISENKLNAGLRQRVYPFGDAVELTEWSYAVYAVLLERWIAERSGGTEP